MNVNYVKNGKNEFKMSLKPLKRLTNLTIGNKIISDTKKIENFRKEEW